jgi:catechol-2,3-dioxygenase
MDMKGNYLMGKIEFDAVILECKSPKELSRFYAALLDYKPRYNEGEEWRDIISSDGMIKLAFQYNEDYIPPVWPDQKGKPQMMMHLDFKVKNQDELKQAVTKALSLGAILTDAQFGGDDWVTLIDPEGHPFCFVIW